jgi:transcriptional regulator with XRE-family HTH domain
MNAHLSQMPALHGDFEAQFAYEIGLRIRDKRLHRKMSREELGRRLGVHRNTVERWEDGGHMSMWMFLRICDELSVPHTMMLPNHAIHLGAAIRQMVREREGKKPVQAERDPPLSHDEKQVYGVR